MQCWYFSCVDCIQQGAHHGTGFFFFSISATLASYRSCGLCYCAPGCCAHKSVLHGVFTPRTKRRDVQACVGNRKLQQKTCFRSVLLVRARGPAFRLGVHLLGFPAVVCAATPTPTIASLCNSLKWQQPLKTKHQQIPITHQLYITFFGCKKDNPVCHKW